MKYFLDTSYLVALTHSKDQYHEEAIKLTKTLEHPIALITTEVILMEYGNILSSINVREKAFQYMKILRDSKQVEIISIDSEIFENGLNMFGQYRDKNWGLVDCISFSVMKDKEILYALTSDEHFEQAGFVVCLKNN